MIFLTIVLLLSLVEYIFFKLKESEINQYIEYVKLMKLDKIKHVSIIVDFYGNALGKYKKLFIGSLIFINIVIALVLSVIINFILSIC